MHYSISIQDSINYGTFEWIHLYKFRNPYITCVSIWFKPNQGQVMNNIDRKNNDEYKWWRDNDFNTLEYEQLIEYVEWQQRMVVYVFNAG